MHDQGWRFFLDNLEAYVTDRPDQRPAVFQMKTTTAAASKGAGP
jgi:hypothetical protein